jgi:hypothetical protein
MKDRFSIKDQIESSPALKSAKIDYDHSWTLDRGGILNIYDNLDIGDFERITKHNLKIDLVQFSRQFNVDVQTLQLLNSNIFLKDSSTHFKEVFNGYGSFNDLHFLKHLPDLKSFGFGAFYKIDISPIKDYVQLTDFGLGGYNIPLKPIEGYKHFKSFGFGEKIKDTKIISTFLHLENLGISSQNFKSLDFILPLQYLKRISFSFGGTVIFNDLVSIKSLEELDIWRTRKLEVEHLIPINDIQNLRTLKLRELPRIENFNWLENPSLQTLVIEELKGLKSYETLENKKNIKTLILKDRLDKDKISSLANLSNINSIQVYKWYLDNEAEAFALLPNAEKIREIDIQYLR